MSSNSTLLEQSNSISHIIQTILKVLYSIQHNPNEILDDNVTIKVEYIDSPILFLRLCKEVSNSNIGSILVYCDVLNISNDSNIIESSDVNIIKTDVETKILKLNNDLIYKSIELGYFKEININISQSIH